MKQLLSSRATTVASPFLEAPSLPPSLPLLLACGPRLVTLFWALCSSPNSPQPRTAYVSTGQRVGQSGRATQLHSTAGGALVMSAAAYAGSVPVFETAVARSARGKVSTRHNTQHHYRHRIARAWADSPPEGGRWPRKESAEEMRREGGREEVGSAKVCFESLRLRLSTATGTCVTGLA
eukprot:3314923-Rhodomonas_salina.1